MATDILSHDEIRYALAKQIPAIERDGSYVHTVYGDIMLDRAAAHVVAGLLRTHFELKLEKLEKQGGGQ